MVTWPQLQREHCKSCWILPLYQCQDLLSWPLLLLAYPYRWNHLLRGPEKIATQFENSVSMLSRYTPNNLTHINHMKLTFCAQNADLSIFIYSLASLCTWRLHKYMDICVIISKWIPLTNWLQGPYCKLWTKFCPLQLTLYGPSVLAIKPQRIRNLLNAPWLMKMRLVRYGIYYISYPWLQKALP